MRRLGKQNGATLQPRRIPMTYQYREVLYTSLLLALLTLAVLSL